MLKATQVLDEPADGAPLASDALVLPFELRQKSRLVANLSSGRQISLQLPRGHVLRDGSKLAASDGSVILVRAAEEDLSVVASDDPTELLRAAYHLGNRHVALQIRSGRIAYLHDHVLDDMLRGLGLDPSVAREPFEPESGAYGRVAGHHHDQHEPHDHHH